MTDATATSEKTAEQYEAELDEFAQTALARLRGWAKDITDKDATVQAAKGNVQGLLEKLRETSTNPEVVKIREAIDQVTMNLFKLEEHRDNLLKPEADAIKAKATENSAGLEDEVKELRSKFNTARKFFADVVDDENAVLALVPKLPGASRGPGAGSGTGVRRIRHRNWKIENQTDESVKVFDNASGAAKYVELKTEEFQKLFFDAAGSEDQTKWDDEVTFEVVVNDTLTYTVISRSTEGAKPSAPVIEEAAATEVTTDGENVNTSAPDNGENDEVYTPESF